MVDECSFRYLEEADVTWTIWIFWLNREKVLEETEVDHSKNIPSFGIDFSTRHGTQFKVFKIKHVCELWNLELPQAELVGREG